MRRAVALHTVVFCLLARPAIAEEVDPADAAGLAEIIGEDDAIDEAVIEPEDQQNWALRELLTRDFAQSRCLERQLDRRFYEEIERQSSPAWLEAIEQSGRELALRGVQHHHSGQNLGGMEFDIPLADHPLVDVYIDYFTGRGRWFFQLWLERADRYIPLLRPLLAEQGLPLDTVYLAMIESGFSAKAWSTARASGFWQFIESTGRTYGLENDTWVDERRDFEKATLSAARYLNDLFREFGDWQLAWAAYNAGAGRIRRALAKYGATTFWDLVAQRRALAKETQHYVPKIIAAALIAKDRARYGFVNLAPQVPPTWQTVEVPNAIDLRVVAGALKIPLDDLRDLNPELRHEITPPGRPYELRVPVGQAESVQKIIASVPQHDWLNYKSYRVQRGDTLGQIARRFGTSLVAIVEFNRLPSAHRLSVGQELVIPQLRDTTPRRRTGGAVRATVYGSDRPPPQMRVAEGMPRIRDDGEKHTVHVVASGDTLWSIAQRYGVSVDWIKRKNNRRSNAIGVGEVLRIN